MDLKEEIKKHLTNKNKILKFNLKQNTIDIIANSFYRVFRNVKNLKIDRPPFAKIVKEAEDLQNNLDFSTRKNLFMYLMKFYNDPKVIVKHYITNYQGVWKPSEVSIKKFPYDKEKSLKAFKETLEDINNTSLNFDNNKDLYRHLLYKILLNFTSEFYYLDIYYILTNIKVKDIEDDLIVEDYRTKLATGQEKLFLKPSETLKKTFRNFNTLTGGEDYLLVNLKGERISSNSLVKFYNKQINPLTFTIVKLLLSNE